MCDGSVWQMYTSWSKLSVAWKWEWLFTLCTKRQWQLVCLSIKDWWHRTDFQRRGSPAGDRRCKAGIFWLHFKRQKQHNSVAKRSTEGWKKNVSLLFDSQVFAIQKRENGQNGDFLFHFKTQKKHNTVLPKYCWTDGRKGHVWLWLGWTKWREREGSVVMKRLFTEYSQVKSQTGATDLHESDGHAGGAAHVGVAVLQRLHVHDQRLVPERRLHSQPPDKTHWKTRDTNVHWSTKVWHEGRIFDGFLADNIRFVTRNLWNESVWMEKKTTHLRSWRSRNCRWWGAARWCADSRRAGVDPGTWSSS